MYSTVVLSDLIALPLLAAARSRARMAFGPGLARRPVVPRATTMPSALFSRRTLIAALSGSSASALAMALLFPLERVRLLSMTGKQGSVVKVLAGIFAQRGYGGLFQGMRPSLISLATSNFVYHYCLTYLKEITAQWFARQARRKRPRLSSREARSPIVELFLAAVAGSINVLVSTPLWVACTRISLLQQDDEPSDSHGGDEETCYGETPLSSGAGLLSTMRSIAREEGVATLWSGLLPSLILVSNPAIQFVAYEQFRHYLRAWRGGKLGSVQYFFLGAAAKLVATLLTYPLQVAKARLQLVKQRGTEGDNDVLAEARWGTIGCVVGICRREGFGGLFRGMNAKIVQTVLTSAFMFAFYEKIQVSLEELFDE